MSGDSGGDRTDDSLLAHAFARLLAGVRAGDDAAARQLFADFGPELQRVIRFELRKTRQNPVYEVEDVLQSVLRTFFVRAGLGQYDLASPTDLRRLLARIAHNKVVGIVRRETADRRGGGLVRAADCVALPLAAPGETPSQLVGDRELLRQFEARLPERVRQLRDLRRDGRSWDDIAALLGGTPEGLRKELSRGIDEAANALGIEDLGDD